MRAAIARNAGNFDSPRYPPVTGLNNNSAPVANAFDDTGFFQGRGRAGSASGKRPRTESQLEFEAAYDLGKNYNQDHPPPRQPLDTAHIQNLLVAASAIAKDVTPMADDPTTPPTQRAVIAMLLAMMNLMEAVVERGIVPISATAAAVAKKIPASRTANPPAVAAKPAPPPGKQELIDALKKADLETVVFDVNLGTKPISNRDILANSFSVTLNQQTIAAAEKNDKDSAESVRLVDDALSSAENIEFLGGRTKEFENKRSASDPRNRAFCTMPVKLSFPDRSSRILFERTLSAEAGIRATQSYPKNVRTEMTLFRNALLEKYPDHLIMTRPAPLPALELIAFQKRDGEPKWQQLDITHPLPLNIMLRSYSAPNKIILPCESMDGDGAANGGGNTDNGEPECS